MENSELPRSSAIDPMHSFASRSRDGATQPAEFGLVPARRALLSAYAALDPKLRAELERVEPGLVVDVDDPLDAVVEAANVWDEAPDRPRVHPIHLAQATMQTLRGRSRDSLPDLAPIIRVLVGALNSDVPDIRFLVEEELRQPEPDIRRRWAKFHKAFVGRASVDQLTPELRQIPVAWCMPELRSYRGEIVARVETRLVVEKAATDLDTLAAAVMPGNWRTCNEFFCSLDRREDRDPDCAPPATGGTLAVSTPNWRGVYEERVGRCPEGWYPDTFLVFTWNRTPTQIILMYELAPQRTGDRTVLRVDEGYLQVSQINNDTYDVSTVKYLLYDDNFIPGGGQTLGQAACQMGWLDYSINQFTGCADQLAGGATAERVPGETTGETPAATPGGHPGGLDADLQEVLKACQGNIAQSVSETDDQLRRIVARIQAGQYGPDAAVMDAGQLLARAIRDSARSAIGHRELLSDYDALLRRFIRRSDDRP
jgi:hypothetical protein